MNPEKNRTGETWQGALDQLKPQGFNPDISISDAGGGMKLGLGLAFPDCVQHGDVFHNLWDLGRSVFNVQRKALARLEEHSREEYQVFYGKNWVNKTAAAYERDDAAIDSILVQADNINILYGWAKELMNFSGYSKATTVELLGWVLDEMQNEIYHSGNLNHAVNTLRKRLDCATSFIDQLNTKMMATAETLRIPLQTFHLLYRQRTYPVGSAGYGFITDRVVRLLHGSKELMVEVASTLDYLIADTKRASSIVENLNSRIRIYLNDKRGFGHSFAQLLQLAINTKRYRRSLADGRRSKSPLQLLSGDSRSFLDVLIPDWRLHVAVAA